MSALTRLRLALALFFIALAVPTAALIQQAFKRLQWETFHQHQGLAEEFATRIDQRLRELTSIEDARPFTEYSYFNLVTPRSGALLQRSPLASLPPPAAVPGLIGHFQVDSDGQLSVPFEPPPNSDPRETGLDDVERAARATRAAQLRAVLASNRLLVASKRNLNAYMVESAAMKDARRVDQAGAAKEDQRAAPEPANALAFDSLNASAPAAPAAAPAAKSLGRVADLKLEKNFQGAPVMAESAAPRDESEARLKQKAAPRKEAGALPAESDQLLLDRNPGNVIPPTLRVHAFESEVGSFESSLLASGELVLYRNVWRDGRRYVQGLLIDRERFLSDLVTAPFELSPLAHTSSLLVARRGEVLMRAAAVSTRDYDSATTLRGTLLYQSRLSAPFSDFELIFSVTRLPAGPGASVIGWLALVLCGGLWLALRLATRQLALARQQQEFIAAVSHELKTPLTSIRMYGEMLREGWAPEEKRREYYSFIHDEAERLTRLINNVLNLARMTRNELKVELRAVTVAELMDVLRSKLDSVIEHAGRSYRLDCAPSLADVQLLVDVDCFTQVMLNLVDNALKFTHGEQAIEVSARDHGDSHVEFAVRDFGPGIAKDQTQRIFALFHRGENAVTRATAGTGIGLALVKQLVEVMGGNVTVGHCEPGAEFRVRLPRMQG